MYWRAPECRAQDGTVACVMTTAPRHDLLPPSRPGDGPRTAPAAGGPRAPTASARRRWARSASSASRPTGPEGQRAIRQTMPARPADRHEAHHRAERRSRSCSISLQRQAHRRQRARRRRTSGSSDPQCTAASGGGSSRTRSCTSGSLHIGFNMLVLCRSARARAGRRTGAVRDDLRRVGARRRGGRARR